MVSTHLKNISQIGSSPQVGVKNKKYLQPPPRSVCHVRDYCKPRQTFEPPQRSPGYATRRPWRLQLLPTSIQGIGLHVFSDGFRSPNPYDVHSGLANSLRMKKRLGRIDVLLFGWEKGQGTSMSNQSFETRNLFESVQDFKRFSGSFRHIQANSRANRWWILSQTQLNWWMEHGTQTTSNITNLRSWPNYARPFHSFRISRWPSPNYPPQCYCRPSQELANRPGHTCQRRNDLRSFGLQQLKYRLGQRFKQRQLEQERQPLLISHGKNVATKIK